MPDLFHALARDFNHPWGCLLSFLDERVKHHDATADQRAEEDPSYSVGAFQAQFKQAIAERVVAVRCRLRLQIGLRRPIDGRNQLYIK